MMDLPCTAPCGPGERLKGVGLMWVLEEKEVAQGHQPGTAEPPEPAGGVA